MQIREQYFFIYQTVAQFINLWKKGHYLNQLLVSILDFVHGPLIGKSYCHFKLCVFQLLTTSLLTALKGSPFCFYSIYLHLSLLI